MKKANKLSASCLDGWQQQVEKLPSVQKLKRIEISLFRIRKEDNGCWLFNSSEMSMALYKGLVDRNCSKFGLDNFLYVNYERIELRRIPRDLS